MQFIVRFLKLYEFRVYELVYLTVFLLRKMDGSEICVWKSLRLLQINETVLII
jgi:hypothetical protein